MLLKCYLWFLPSVLRNVSSLLEWSTFSLVLHLYSVPLLFVFPSKSLTVIGKLQGTSTSRGNFLTMLKWKHVCWQQDCNSIALLICVCNSSFLVFRSFLYRHQQDFLKPILLDRCARACISISGSGKASSNEMIISATCVDRNSFFHLVKAKIEVLECCAKVVERTALSIVAHTALLTKDDNYHNYKFTLSFLGGLFPHSVFRERIAYSKIKASLESFICFIKKMQHLDCESIV